MDANVKLTELVEATDWERSVWHDALGKRGDGALAVSVGAHGDGRIRTIGELVKHIFIAEKHHVERLTNRPLTPPEMVVSDSVERVFAFGRESRKDLKAFIEANPASDWDVAREYDILGDGVIVSVTPRKFVVHILTHEIRHWAQIATLLRLNGLGGGFPDFLFGPAMGGGVWAR